MAKAFSDIITEDLKDTFDDGIKAMLESTGVTTPCRLNFGTTKYVLCDNCIYDPIAKKSANRYLTGGPAPFSNKQICPVCGGAGRIDKESNEEINLMVIWDMKSWIDIGVNINAPEGYIQTISDIDSLPKIKKAKEIIVNTDIEKFVTHRYIRHIEPVPAGLGRDSFLVTMWKRSN